MALNWIPVVLAIHVLGAIIWVGGNLSLGVAVWALRRTLRDQPETLARVTSEVGRSFAWVMWPALAATLATGMANLSWYLPAGEDWTASPAAPWLLLSVALAVLMVVAAGLHTFFVGPGVRRLRERGASSTQVDAQIRINRGLEGVTIVTAVLIVLVMVILTTL